MKLTRSVALSHFVPFLFSLYYRGLTPPAAPQCPFPPFVLASRERERRPTGWGYRWSNSRQCIATSLSSYRATGGEDVCVITLTHHLFQEPLRTPAAEEAEKCAAELHALDEEPDCGRRRGILYLLRDPLLKFGLPDQRVRQKGVDDPVARRRPEYDE